FINSTTAGHSGLLSRLLKKDGQRNQPVLLVLDNAALNDDRERREVDGDYYPKDHSLPLYLQSLLE
ncbi:hypothetical protein ABMA28_010537, partial [Loxostege sticticalis]